MNETESPSHTRFIRGLHAGAPGFRLLINSKSDRFRYDALSEAVVYDDEIPPMTKDITAAVKVLIRYRASLTLNEPDLQYELYWKLGQELFPVWIGFSAARIHPPAHVETFLREHVEATRLAWRRSAENAERRRIRKASIVVKQHDVP